MRRFHSLLCAILVWAATMLKKYLPFGTSLALTTFVIAANTAAMADVSWRCSTTLKKWAIQFSNSRYEEAGDTLVGPRGDMSSERPKYHIIENTESGLIAVLHRSQNGKTFASGKSVSSVEVFVLNKISGKFSVGYTDTGVADLETYGGNCQRD